MGDRKESAWEIVQGAKKMDLFFACEVEIQSVGKQFY